MNVAKISHYGVFTRAKWRVRNFLDRSSRPTQKVFGIGLSKTGTTSLGVCFIQLGFRHATTNLALTRKVRRGELEPVFAFADRYDSFEDWPWSLLYRELDARYPGSKFILTTRRDPATWLRSLEEHATRTGPTEFRKLTFGYAMPHGHEAEHLAFYERHNDAVREHFRGRTDDFLEVCWETGAGWADLCRFLGRPLVDRPFPHANRHPESRGALLWHHARRILGAPFRG